MKIKQTLGTKNILLDIIDITHLLLRNNKNLFWFYKFLCYVKFYCCIYFIIMKDSSIFVVVKTQRNQLTNIFRSSTQNKPYLLERLGDAGEPDSKKALRNVKGL